MVEAVLWTFHQNDTEKDTWTHAYEPMWYPPFPIIPMLPTLFYGSSFCIVVVYAVASDDYVKTIHVITCYYPGILRLGWTVLCTSPHSTATADTLPALEDIQTSKTVTLMAVIRSPHFIAVCLPISYDRAFLSPAYLLYIYCVIFVAIHKSFPWTGALGQINII